MAAPIGTDIAQMFDSYGRQARLFPGLLAIFPPLLAVLAWFPWFLLSNVAATLLTLAMSCGLLYALGSYARTKGRRLEPKLLQEWGGWPTTLLLRHDSDLDRHTRSRYHEFLRGSAGTLLLPSVEQERTNSNEANAMYDSAIRWLKERARDKEFIMVHRENAQYGFRRNLRGLKTLAITLCLITLTVMIVSVAYRTPGFVGMFGGHNWSGIMRVLGTLGPAVLSAVVINALAIPIWIFVVTKEWVREAGFQYASALLATCDQIESNR